MKLYKDIVIDLYKPAPIAVMYVPQYNTARGARVTLVADGQIIVPTGETVKAYMQKPDRNIVYTTCTVSGSNILIDLDEQATAAPGKLELELEIIDNGDNLVTPVCEVVISASNINYAMLTSTSEFTALVDALNKVNNFEVIDPANAVVGDIGKCADAYYTHTALELQSADIAANAAAIREQNEKMLRVKEYDLTLIYSSANVLRAVLTHGLGVTPKACAIKPWGTTGTIRNFGYVLSNDTPNGQTIQINALSSSKWVSGDELPVKITLLY